MTTPVKFQYPANGSMYDVEATWTATEQGSQWSTKLWKDGKFIGTQSRSLGAKHGFGNPELITGQIKVNLDAGIEAD